MNKEIKNGSDQEVIKKESAKKKSLTKKDLEIIINELKDKELRLRAEFDNFRKRKKSEIADILKYEGKNFILDFLSILDTINRGIESYKDQNIKDALDLIQKDFLKKMEEKEENLRKQENQPNSLRKSLSSRKKEENGRKWKKTEGDY